jgi:cytochrome c553
VAFFNEKIQPILAICSDCHNAKKHKGDLVVDSLAHLMAGGDQGPVITPGDPEGSLLIRAVRYSDDKLQMPPKKKLAADQIAALEEWVKRGVPWPGEEPPAKPVAVKKGFHITDEQRKWWAYQPVVRPAVPTVKNTGWVKNPIDAFVLASLEAAGLSPNGPAERRQLVRRVYYDLIGLPPTPAESDAFVNDASPQAFKHLVEKLLASPHYGEKWGRYWLDVVRYAETNGYERDGMKQEVWRYRDYVIDAFNNDKPYDQFVREQLAGDELPGAGVTLETLTATGFLRLGIWDDEPADREQALNDNLDDIVTTTGQAFLAMSINCARCHDHKRDPIGQADYYKLLAFFRNITGNMRDAQPALVTDADRKQFDALTAQRRHEADAIQKQVTAIERQFLAKLGNAAPTEGLATDIENLHYRYYRDTWDKLPDFDALKPEDEGDVRGGLFDIGLRTRDTAFGFVFEGTLIVPADAEYTFYLDSDDGSRLTVDGKTLLTYDGIHGVGKEKIARVNLKAGRVPIRFDYFQKLHGFGFRVMWTGPGFSRRELSTLHSYNPMSPETGDPPRVRELKKLINKDGLRVLGKPTFDQYTALRKQLTELSKPAEAPKRLMVTESKAPLETFVLTRGSAHAPGDKVEPSFPLVFNSPAPSVTPGPRSTGRRTALADWITSPKNPLTARVMVNRIWQGHFGRGIVRTSNDFGRLGDLPTHPELLDWLAAQFVESGWKIKDLHRLILSSCTYQMSATQPNEAALAKDPSNDLLWRMDMRRLTAEEVRDSILTVNGTLNPKMGGPSMYTIVPEAVLAGASRPKSAWGQSPPDEQLRRSVYIHRKRSLVEPVLSTFDVADTDVSCPLRFATTVPTQALTMLNSEFIQREAAALAARLKREAGDDSAAQVRLALRLCMSREPSEAEVARGVKLITDLHATDRLPADKALHAFCLMALNLNEFIYLD